MNIREEMIEKYREELGCTHTDICWCEVCVIIEKIVDDVIEMVKKKIDE